MVVTDANEVRTVRVTRSRLNMLRTVNDCLEAYTATTANMRHQEGYASFSQVREMMFEAFADSGA